MITYNEFRFDRDNDILYYFDFPITHDLYKEIIKLYNKNTTDRKSENKLGIAVDGIEVKRLQSIVLKSNDDIIHLSIPTDIERIKTYLHTLDGLDKKWRPKSK
jgi:ABC-type sulfate transport system substrate-binding protein